MRVLKNTHHIFLIVFISVLLLPIVAGSEEPPKAAPQKPKAVALPTLIVFDITPEKGVEQGAANVLTEIVLDKVTKTGRYQVIGMKEIDKMLSFEQTKQLKGCTDTKCLVQIAGALGAMFYIEGSVGAMGDMYIVTLKMIDAMEVKVINRDTQRVNRDEKTLVDAIDRMVRGMMGEDLSKDTPKSSPPPLAAQTPPPAVNTKASYPMNPYKMWGHITFWSGLGVAGLGGMFTGLAYVAANDYKTGTNPSGDSSKLDAYNGAAIAMYATGGALMATGIILWIVSPGDEAWANKNKVAFAPVFDSTGGGLMVWGGW